MSKLLKEAIESIEFKYLKGEICDTRESAMINADTDNWLEAVHAVPLLNSYVWKVIMVPSRNKRLVKRLTKLFIDPKEEQMNLFNRCKTDAELQAELKALVYRCIFQPDTRPLDRYQEILEEMFNRGIEPESILKPLP